MSEEDRVYARLRRAGFSAEMIEKMPEDELDLYVKAVLKEGEADGQKDV